MVETDDKFTWAGPDYGMRELLGGKIGFNERGTFIVDGFTTPPADRRGSFWTSIPISPLSYRKKHSTKAAYKAGYRTLTIYCDWGRAHRVGAHEEVIKRLVEELDAQEIHRVEEDLPVRA